MLILFYAFGPSRPIPCHKQPEKLSRKTWKGGKTKRDSAFSEQPKQGTSQADQPKTIHPIKDPSSITSKQLLSQPSVHRQEPE
jgi:hypothetical protein